MTQPSAAHRLETRFALAPFSPGSSMRRLALYAASIALADDVAQANLVAAFRTADAPRATLYEVVLQSYLFLGFPRMLTAAENLAAAWPADPPVASESTCEDFAEWKNRGFDLYSEVYGGNAVRLRERVNVFAPEIFEWMILEGYGKVLSRPGLDIATRELAIVAFLVIENRPRQLTSHIRGALRVGVKPGLINETIVDLETLSPLGAQHGLAALRQLQDKA